MRVVFWLISAVVVASKDASAGLPDVNDAFGDAMGSLVLSEAAKAVAYAGVMQVASKFESILTSIEDLVKRDQAMVEKVSKFANVFRPVQFAAHNLVVEMESLSLSLSGDMLPSLEDVWTAGAYDQVSPAINDIQEAFEEPLSQFDEVKKKYEELSVEADTLSSEALAHALGVAASKNKHLVEGGVAVAVVVGGTGVIAVGTMLTPLALAYLASAGFCVTAGAAGIVVSYSQHEAKDQIAKSAMLLSDVMLEIRQLMITQSKNLATIRRKSLDVEHHTKKIELSALELSALEEQSQVCASTKTCVSTKTDGKKEKKQDKQTVQLADAKVKRLLSMLRDTSQALAKQCGDYRDADTAGQQAVWEKLQKHADHAMNSVADQNQAISQ